MLILIVPAGGGPPAQSIKDAVHTMVTVTKPCPTTTTVNVQDPLYRTVNVGAIVYLEKGANAATVRAAIGAAVRQHFAVLRPDQTPNPEIDFGARILDENGDPAGEVVLSRVQDVINDVAGVRKIDDGPEGVTLSGKRQSLAIGLKEFPLLGTITVVNGATGQPL